MLQKEVERRPHDRPILQPSTQLRRIQTGKRQKSFGPTRFRNNPADDLQPYGMRIIRSTVHMLHREVLCPSDARCANGLGGLVAKRIFVVEDNALNLRLFCDLLNAHGHDTCAVRDGREAFEKAVDYRPDLIITDIQLPHVSGVDLIRQFRQDETMAVTPIMAVTAYAGPGDEERIRAAGANIYVSKPISVVKFIGVVNELFAMAGEAAFGGTSAEGGQPAHH